MRRITSGAFLIAIGVVHQLVGLVMGLGLIAPAGTPRRNLLAEIVRDGVVGAVERDPLRSAFFWFGFFGFVLLALGGFLRRVELDGGRVPRALGWQLGAIGLAGGALIPASGFWLVLPVAWRLLRQSSSSKSNPSPSGQPTQSGSLR